jgi:hypothetical protein
MVISMESTRRVWSDVVLVVEPDHGLAAVGPVVGIAVGRNASDIGGCHRGEGEQVRDENNAVRFGVGSILCDFRVSGANVVGMGMEDEVVQDGMERSGAKAEV